MSGSNLPLDRAFLTLGRQSPDVDGLCFNAIFLEVDAKKKLTSRGIWCTDHWRSRENDCGIQASVTHFCLSLRNAGMCS